MKQRTKNRLKNFLLLYVGVPAAGEGQQRRLLAGHHGHRGGRAAQAAQAGQPHRQPVRGGR